MAKSKTVFICNECGATYPTWSGRCASCGSWNTLVEEKQKKIRNFSPSPSVSKPEPITQAKSEHFSERISTRIKTLDEALGGGIVKGQVILVSGEPGIGKSTLLLQVSSNISEDRKVLYITGEESAHQVYIRGERIGALKNNLFVLSETVLENITEAIKQLKPDFIVVDSVQTVYSTELESPAGSVSQVREVSARLTEISKSMGIPSIIVGQVTKEGSIAGPKVLEHIVDTVAQFEGERGHAYRVLKVIKNRFGAAGELAVFSMEDRGLKEVLNPSSFFLEERPEGKAGSVIFPFTEGSKPVLVEIQALVSKTVYAVPQRKTQGIDINRLSIITAIIEKETGIFLKDRDIFVNVVGGITVKEPAVDLPVALAILSSLKNTPLPPDLAAFGELGLTGEVRSVYYTEHRIKEAKKFGFGKILVPANTDIQDSRIIKVKNIQEAIEYLR
ncbi:DNA repair protein RadA/Sms [Persephonella hydrogeniphila]|uniref:DNA repair protein RadA n=1 Tax=Persephonella hydrogeniphila TaxID=198703 RepID=A0A285NFB1_9AQUI|nr:DNA repair protein RadA [Persephonella hydrogeniphila]SNZ07958.1 DNA repair protein RadA/Sms [Persephonella hydrogeniphila]